MGLSGQGRVHADGKVGDRFDHPLIFDLSEEVEQLLGTAYGKGGDNNVATFGKHVVNEGGQGLGIALWGLVVPVAVGGLHDDIIRLCHKGGSRMTGWSTLPRSPEKTSFLVTPFSVAQISTQEEPSRWPGVAEADLYTLAQLEDLSVLLGIEELEGLLRVCQGVGGALPPPGRPAFPSGSATGHRSPEYERSLGA